MLECKYGMVLLNPAYTTYRLNLGEISSYPPGYKENAGIFCHNNPWIIFAETIMGHGNRAFDLYKKTCPAYLEDIGEIHKTLEGNPAGLPYGGTSGNWGDSGSTWTEQYGTPIGADITYYAGYEDTFYHLDVDFPIDTIKDYMERAYSRKDDPKEETQEYKRLGKGHKSGYPKAYDSFSDLVFGFAPKGMVVVLPVPA